ncbi:MAG: carbohydrate ABC transporter permease [Actinomycetota bacterium]
MTTITHTPQTTPSWAEKIRTHAGKRTARLSAIIIAIIWTIPTTGLLITSFRSPTDINKSGWWTAITNPNFTLDNYRTSFEGSGSGTLTNYLLNSIIITIPSVILPIFLASLAAYAFAWMNFKGRNALFIAVFTLQIVPLQVALVPLLSLYTNQLQLQGTYWSAWLSHTIFALPLAIFLLHNFIKDIPAELIEAARMDGAGHVRIFFRLMLPLLTPALAAFSIFQFLWVWNDLLISLVFLGGTPDVRPLTVELANLVGSRGSAWYLLSSGAFISMTIPIIIFLALQRYFVRGLLAGSVKS